MTCVIVVFVKYLSIVNKPFDPRLTCESAVLTRLLDSVAQADQQQQQGGHTALLYILVMAMVVMVVMIVHRFCLIHHSH